MQQFIKKRPLLITLVLLALIVLHGLFSASFKVDNTTLLLVLFIILMPYIPLLNRVKFGDFEAEISHEKINRVGEKLGEIPESELETPKPRGSIDLELLAEDDPTLALAKVRIEIEKRVRSLGEIYLKNSTRQRSLAQQIRALEGEKVIEPSLSALLLDIVGVANQAIHGSRINESDAVRLARYAVRAMEELDGVVTERALQSESKVIDSKIVKTYENANYIVKTIVPLVKSPEMRTYRLNQAELDAFLDGYDEYAEFIVGVQKVAVDDVDDSFDVMP